MSTTTEVGEIGQVVGVQEDTRRRHWLEHVVHRRMKRALERARKKKEAGAYGDLPPDERAEKVVRWACVKTAVTGAMSGAAATGAVVATAETKGVAGVIALPLAAAAIGAEMVARAVVEVDLACELAEIFNLKLDDADDVLRLLALGPERLRGADEDELGKDLVKRATIESDDLFSRAANVLVGESVLRNLLPFVGIVSSAVTNVVVTRRVGRTMRRAFRYERAMLDALTVASGPCASCMELLIEGLWFVFIADGRLSVEETSCLAARLDDLDEDQRRRTLKRFTADESDWLSRLRSVPDEAKKAFLGVLEIAAALDKSLVLPEEKLLRRVAEAWGLTYTRERVGELIEQFERGGVLA
ncbi:MAG TPA: hypothetical protein VM580_27730 [Labilithrix sp.]|nr:hypothetical protein [Labilithrix sp.]